MNIQEQMVKALIADAPIEKLKDKLNLFGQFVGAWDLDWIGYNPDGTKQHEKGEWIFCWVLEGRVIQDIWIVPSRDNRGKPGFPEGEYGTTLRFYSEKEDAWKVVWVGPARDRLTTLVARKIGEEIVLEVTNEKDFQMKWIFSEITENSFHWRSIVSENGDDWKLVQEIMGTRKERK